MKGDKLVYTIPEVAVLLSISRGKAYELAKTEGFPVIRMGKTLRVPSAAFERWLNKAVV